MNGRRLAPGVSTEQLLYARILSAGMWTGLAILLITFAVYTSGALEPVTPIKELPQVWTLNAHDYLEVINTRHLQREHDLTGWWWLSALDRGDYLNYVGIALLSLITIVCTLGIVPTLLRKRDWVYAAIALAEAMVLTLAASGVLTVGGH